MCLCLYLLLGGGGNYLGWIVIDDGGSGVRLFCSLSFFLVLVFFSGFVCVIYSFCLFGYPSFIHSRLPSFLPFTYPVFQNVITQTNSTQPDPTQLNQTQPNHPIHPLTHLPPPLSHPTNPKRKREILRRNIPVGGSACTADLADGRAMNINRRASR